MSGINVKKSLGNGMGYNTNLMLLTIIFINLSFPPELPKGSESTSCSHREYVPNQKSNIRSRNSAKLFFLIFSKNVYQSNFIQIL